MTLDNPSCRTEHDSPAQFSTEKNARIRTVVCTSAPISSLERSHETSSVNKCGWSSRRAYVLHTHQPFRDRTLHGSKHDAWEDRKLRRQHRNPNIPMARVRIRVSGGVGVRVAFPAGTGPSGLERVGPRVFRTPTRFTKHAACSHIAVPDSMGRHGLCVSHPTVVVVCLGPDRFPRRVPEVRLYMRKRIGTFLFRTSLETSLIRWNT